MDAGDDVAAGEVLGLDLVDGQDDAGFRGPDARIHDHAIGHLTQPHGHQVDHADIGARQPRSQPDAEKGEDNPDQDQAGDTGGDEKHDV